MPKLIYYVAASLDGYIATPDGGVAWLAPYEASGDDYGYAEFYASVDAVIMGSRTYEQSLSFADQPYPGKPLWVFTRRQLNASQPAATQTKKSPQAVLRDLETRGLNRVWLVGGARLAASCRAQGLISQYIVSVIPVILGGGVPLFASAGASEDLRLIDAKRYPGGLVQLQYSSTGSAS